jgi:transcriptional regulator with XRE-family HTH domain
LLFGNNIGVKAVKRYHCCLVATMIKMRLIMEKAGLFSERLIDAMIFRNYVKFTLERSTTAYEQKIKALDRPRFIREMQIWLQENSQDSDAELEYDFRSTMSRYLAGKRTPTAFYLRGICEILNVSADYMIGLKAEMTPLWGQNTEFFKGYIEATLASTNYWDALIGNRRNHLDKLDEYFRLYFKPIMEEFYEQNSLNEKDKLLFFDATCALIHFWDFGLYNSLRLKYVKKAIGIAIEMLSVTESDIKRNEIEHWILLLKLDGWGYALTELNQNEEAIDYLRKYIDEYENNKKYEGKASNIYLLPYIFSARAYRKLDRLDKAFEMLETGERNFIIENCEFDIKCRYFEQLGDYWIAKSKKIDENTDLCLENALEAFKSILQNNRENYFQDDRLHDGGYSRVLQCLISITIRSLEINNTYKDVYISDIVKYYSLLKNRNQYHDLPHISWLYTQLEWAKFLSSIQDNWELKNLLQEKIGNDKVEINPIKVTRNALDKIKKAHLKDPENFDERFETYNGVLDRLKEYQ